MFVTCIRSYQARSFIYLSRSCASGVRPKYFLCGDHGRGRKHPQRPEIRLEPHVVIERADVRRGVFIVQKRTYLAS